MGTSAVKIVGMGANKSCKGAFSYIISVLGRGWGVGG